MSAWVDEGLIKTYAPITVGGPFGMTQLMIPPTLKPKFLNPQALL